MLSIFHPPTPRVRVFVYMRVFVCACIIYMETRLLHEQTRGKSSRRHAEKLVRDARGRVSVIGVAMLTEKRTAAA